jgi:hypothetical protein
MTQETLQAENAELKRKLVEAEQWRKTHEVCHDKWDGLQARLAEAEKALADHRRDHETTMKVSRGRWREIVQLRKLREAAERKCAELSEALRWMDRKGGLGLDVHERIKAALASQPAPEARGCNEVDSDGTCCHTPHCGDKPKLEMSAEVAARLAFAETHKCIMSPPCDKCAALEVLAAEVRRLHKPTPEAP